LKILVVDDHPLIRQALQTVLQQLQEDATVLEARDGPAAFSLADAHPDLDLVLLDLHLPGMGGLDALTQLRSRYPAVPVVMLSAADDRRTVIEAIERGAMGYIPKSCANEVMLSALRLVLSGGVYLPPEILDHAGSFPNGGNARPGAEARGNTTGLATLAELGLTERQLQVLTLMAQGKPNKIICRELNLAEGTVKIHVSAILKALNVTSRAQAIVAIGRMGLKLDSPSAP